jgi:hypothetical protein
MIESEKHSIITWVFKKKSEYEMENKEWIKFGFKFPSHYFHLITVRIPVMDELDRFIVCV